MLISRLAEAMRRRAGHTTAAVASGARVLSMNEREAARVRRMGGLASSIHDPEKLRGTTGPCVLDVSALYPLAHDAECRLSDAVERAKRAEMRVAVAEARVAELEAAVLERIAVTSEVVVLERIAITLEAICAQMERGQ